MEPIIRPASQADIDLIVQFSRQLYREDPSFTRQAAFDEEIIRAALVNFVDNPALGRAWLIYRGDEVIGYVVVTLGYSLEYHGRDAFIDELYLKAGQRGQGIGTKVLQFVEAACREIEVNALHLEVERANAVGQGIYRKLGFEDHDRYLMTKWLAT